jgi:hypothetical protein
MLSRRGLITGLISFVAAPAIVRAASLMPVKALPRSYALQWRGLELVFDNPSDEMVHFIKLRVDEAYRATRNFMSESLYADHGNGASNLLEHMES